MTRWATGAIVMAAALVAVFTAPLLQLSVSSAIMCLPLCALKLLSLLVCFLCCFFFTSPEVLQLRSVVEGVGDELGGNSRGKYTRSMVFVD